MKTIIKSFFLLPSILIISCSEAQTIENQENFKNATEQTSSIYKDVDSREFKTLIKEGKGIVLDVRTPSEFNGGFIEGAKNINIADNFSEEILKLDKNKPVYLYCASGGRSSRAMQMMAQLGFKEVYNLKGGYNNWTRQ